jgi:hypothetical protein
VAGVQKILLKKFHSDATAFSAASKLERLRENRFFLYKDSSARFVRLASKENLLCRFPFYIARGAVSFTSQWVGDVSKPNCLFVNWGYKM